MMMECVNGPSIDLQGLLDKSPTPDITYIK